MGDFYEISGEEEKYLFGKTDLKDAIKTNFLFLPFVDAIDKFTAKNERVAIVCLENDFPLGKTLKESFLRSFRQAELIILGEKTLSVNSLTALWRNCDTLLALGGREILALAKVVSAEKNVKSVLIPTDCVQSDILSTIVTVTKNGKRRALKCNPPDVIIIDKNYYFSPKKQYSLEAFEEVVSCPLDILDYKTAVVKNKYEYKKAFVSLVGEAVYYALNVKKFADAREPLMFAQLKLAIAKEYSSALSFSSSSATAKILGKIRPAPFGAAKFAAYTALLPLTKLYLLGDLQKYEVLPDGLRASREISELLNEKEYLTVKTLKNTPTDEELSENRIVKSTVRRSFLNDVEIALKDLEKTDDVRTYLYNGKHRLSSYSSSEVKKAIKTAAYLSENNLLALMRTEGFAEFI